MMKDPEGGLVLLPLLAFARPEPDDEDEDNLPLPDADMEEILAAMQEEIGDDVELALTASVVGIRLYWQRAKSPAAHRPNRKKRVKHKRPHRRK